ncbi:hypothetical protein C5S31_00585, partial [ANME-1 cluster archaeon GoMg2]|nr:hypothetical protein [ANME-1 cluster archaeon GoMg2]
ESAEVTELWNRTYDGVFNDHAKGVATDASGNVIVTGYSHGGCTMCTNNYYTIKYNPTGGTLWCKTYDSGFSDIAKGVATDASGNVIVTGNSNPDGSDTDYYTIKYNPEGYKLWGRTYDGGNCDSANGVATDASGNVIVTGYSQDGSTIKLNYSTIKYDPNGYELWNRTYGGSNYSYSATGVATDASGNVIVTGDSQDRCPWGTYTYDYYTIKYGEKTGTPPEIISSAPESPVNDIERATRTFNITVNQTVNVSWLINGTEVQTNESVTEVTYTNTSAAAGTWNVLAIVTNANGTDMQAWVWNVTSKENQPPVANFTYSPSNPIVAQTITFNASNSTDPDGNITKYEWVFGDGNSTNTTEQNITYSYASAGTFTVNLTVTDDNGTINTTTKEIVIPPVQDTTPPASITTLTSTSGHTWINWTWKNPADADFYYTMVYLNGTRKINTSDPFYNATNLNPGTYYVIGTHTVDNVGNINITWVNQTTKTKIAEKYGVNLTVDLIEKTITPNVNATFILRVKNIGTVTDSYTLTVNNPDAATIANLNKTTIASLAAGANATVLLNVTDETPGTYNVNVTVTSQGNSSVSDTAITKTNVIGNQLPIANFTYSPANPTVAQTITFNASNSTDHDGNITKYEWSFGDGNIMNTTELISTYSYASAGTFTVNLTVTDDDGAINATSQAIIVSEGLVFNTYTGTYPSIAGTHNGTIELNQAIIVQKLYTYPCTGTGGHTEYAKICNESWYVETLPWAGYNGDWHSLSFPESFMLCANETYNYEIRTSSYPQIHHTDALLTANGRINCTEFVDVNGKRYDNWIPAIIVGYNVTPTPPTIGAINIASSPSGAAIELDG